MPCNSVHRAVFICFQSLLSQGRNLFCKYLWKSPLVIFEIAGPLTARARPGFVAVWATLNIFIPCDFSVFILSVVFFHYAASVFLQHLLGLKPLFHIAFRHIYFWVYNYIIWQKMSDFKSHLDFFGTNIAQHHIFSIYNDIKSRLSQTSVWDSLFLIESPFNECANS